MKIWSIPSCRFPEEVADDARVLPKVEETLVLMKAGFEQVKDEIKQVKDEVKQLKDEIKQQEISQDLRLRGEIMDVRNEGLQNYQKSLSMGQASSTKERGA